MIGGLAHFPVKGAVIGRVATTTTTCVLYVARVLLNGVQWELAPLREPSAGVAPCLKEGDV